MSETIAAVLDRTGQVVACTVPGPFRELPGDVSVPLPDGGRLVTRTPDGPAWYRLARAFVHEARSPLNALAIYLDLLGTKVVPAAARADRPDATGQRLIEKSDQQVRRVDELLGAFLDVWAPSADEGVDLATIVRGVGRFAVHEARRRGVTLALEVCAEAPVPVASGPVADALVSTLLSFCAELEGGELHLALTEDAPAFRLVLGASRPLPRFAIERARGLFEAAGARVECGDANLAALFVRAPPVSPQS